MSLVAPIDRRQPGRDHGPDGLHPPHCDRPRPGGAPQPLQPAVRHGRGRGPQGPRPRRRPLPRRAGQGRGPQPGADRGQRRRAARRQRPGGRRLRQLCCPRRRHRRGAHPGPAMPAHRLQRRRALWQRTLGPRLPGAAPERRRPLRLPAHQAAGPLPCRPRGPEHRGVRACWRAAELRADLGGSASRRPEPCGCGRSGSIICSTSRMRPGRCWWRGSVSAIPTAVAPMAGASA